MSISLFALTIKQRSNVWESGYVTQRVTCALPFSGQGMV